MRILIAAGGTGGHIYPALAVLRRLAERGAEPEVRWVGGHRGLESATVPAAGYRLHRLSLRTLRTVELDQHVLMDPIRLALSVPEAAALMLHWRPDVIYTTGGYVAIPVLSAALALRVPSLMWEGNRIPGRSVRAVARLASAIALSYPDASDHLAGRTYVTGTPIRSFAGVDREGARAALDLPADVPLVLVFGGSQAVRRFDAAVEAALPRLVDRCVVLHVTGESAYPDALRRRDTLPAERRDRYRPYPFLREEMTAALRAADLLVGRAGSSTLAEATALGVPMVVVPYPHAGAHQSANAREMADAGAARFIADEAFDGDALVDACALLDDAPAREAMSAASRALGRPGAADANAELLTALAERHPLPDAATIERLTRDAA
ncbi:MAG: UDP-N-acetylglucosamine--N-acetylmuramyl-(pentapeptide) pyrophosphoryl-undecaprenol N-acetylglucosamine transferase [Chloroflexota bacterium]